MKCLSIVRWLSEGKRGVSDLPHILFPLGMRVHDSGRVIIGIRTARYNGASMFQQSLEVGSC